MNEAYDFIIIIVEYLKTIIKSPILEFRMRKFKEMFLGKQAYYLFK